MPEQGEWQMLTEVAWGEVGIDPNKVADLTDEEKEKLRKQGLLKDKE